ncbi:hypothetical protein ACGFMM_34195 [Streptomyces sp. NPDC048604]|uniref:hypothetical protein n=1 Tax=Streptomyces sp. NPDC048604 TaxID=3365578 RepID=UPI003714C483
MIADLLLGRLLDPAVLAAALADAVGVPVGRVDVCHEHGDMDARDWEADVVCTYHFLRGDLAMSLSLYVRDEEGAEGSEGEPRLAAALAARTGAGVVYPDDRIDPETWWLADPGGTVTRMRLVSSDYGEEWDDERPVYTVDAVEYPSVAFPDAKVTPLAEILRGTVIATPVASAFYAGRPVGRLYCWERLVRRMAAGWPPAGRYLPELYEEDLDARDSLERELAALPDPAGLTAATAEVDALFRELTEEDPAAPADARWWRTRRPRRTWAD